jgi:hypothetical protein
LELQVERLQPLFAGVILPNGSSGRQPDELLSNNCKKEMHRACFVISISKLGQSDG